MPIIDGDTFGEEKKVPKQEIYQSSTMGDIPLSFTGRCLLHNLRVAIDKAIQEVSAGAQYRWEPISEARGRIAQYMSSLEQKTTVVSSHTTYKSPTREHGDYLIFVEGAQTPPIFQSIEEASKEAERLCKSTEKATWIVESVGKYTYIERPDTQYTYLRK